jgi:hypothetical protein
MYQESGGVSGKVLPNTAFREGRAKSRAPLNLNVEAVENPLANIFLLNR